MTAEQENKHFTIRHYLFHYYAFFADRIYGNGRRIWL